MSIAEKYEIIADAVYKKGIEEGFQIGRNEGAQAGIEEGIQIGKEAERDKHWGVLLDYGKREDCAGLFKGKYYNNETFNFPHKYKIQPTNCDSMFMSSPITDGELLRGRIDFSKATNTYGLFWASKFTTLPTINLSSCTALNSLFGYCNVQTIEKVILDAEGVTTFQKSAFGYLYSLREIDFEGFIGNDFYIGNSSNLNKKSIENIFEHLLISLSWRTLTLNKSAVNNEFGINVDDETTYTSEWYSILSDSLGSNWTIAFEP